MAISDLFRKKEKLSRKTKTKLRVHRCAFTVHLPERIRGVETEVVAGLWKNILAAIDDGYITFITNCGREVDLWAVNIVLEIRHSSKNLKLICSVPFEGFELKRASDEVTPKS